MQGILYMPQNFQTGSPPPNKHILEENMAMDMSTTGHHNLTKEVIPNQSNRSDSGIFSSTNNSSFPEEQLNMSSRISNSDTDNRSDCSTPDRKYLCPICETMLTSQHEFTLHIRSHNNNSEDEGFTCRICFKVLSSSSSLDRHVLVHTGERPFTCKYCGDTFTTNGNMHRHMRTHKSENYESDGGSTDASSNSSKITEYNNNKIDAKQQTNDNKRKLEQSNDNCKKIKQEIIGNDYNIMETFRCPICSRNDFTSLHNLEMHLEDNHPDYPSKCHQCNQIFENNKQLNYHRSSVHVDENGKNYKNSVVGFKDLTFVDFSSEKFPYIARYECEKNLHKVASGLKFVCYKCSRAFPCANSLDIHKRDCTTTNNPDMTLDLSRNSKLSENDIKRADFFARLDLQNNSPIKDEKFDLNEKFDINERPDNTKDLADIPTILSMTNNGSFLQHLHMKNNENSTTQQTNTEQSMETSKSEQDEETQDIFATEFRKMKLRGEFPCRLCTAIFPNLRALKGHNRQHLNGTTNGTYRCNMCPHSSIDKAALIRHMRTHNGDRPYECSLCNYAFTTKANCERHLRNRHSKSTREEVKKAIIYHPSEDPTNDDLNKLTTPRDENKKSNNISVSSELSDYSPEKIRSSTPKTTHVPTIQEDFNPILPITKPFSNITDIIHNESIKSFAQNDYSPLQKRYVNTSTPHKLSPKIQVKNIDALKQEPPKIEIYNNDNSLDVVLDLSKKKTNTYEENFVPKDEETPQDLTKKTPNVPPPPPVVKDILTQQLLKNIPKFDPSSFYQLALLRSSLTLQNWPAYAINPFLFQNPIIPQDPQEIKERLQRLQLCGGEIIMDNFADRFKNFQQQNCPNINNFKINDIKPEMKYPKNEEIKPLSLNIEPNYPEGLTKLQSPIQQPKPELIQSPNSVKMVIKNGVLMPKQKQRRYRTERPFSCEHCSARFTLRSNMERHIKQQHPQFWSQRQRSNVGTPGRKSQNVTNFKNSYELNVPTYDMLKMPEIDESKEQPISEKIKYAILAQHLRGQTNQNVTKKEEDEDCDLIIDEKDEKHDSESGEHYKNGMSLKHRERPKNIKYKDRELMKNISKNHKNDETQDLVPVSRLLDNACQQQFKEYFRREGDEHEGEGVSEEDEEGLVASGSTSEGNSGTDENKSESENANNQVVVKKKSAYSLAPNRISCPYCERKFPWTSSLRRHILTHTGQKPFKCSQCPLLFTTKSNCDRHLLRKHGNTATTISNDTGNNNNTANYLMRNVPERPYKCNNCPSSTFSTYSNLKKHMNCKHMNAGENQGYEGSSEDEKLPQKMEWESQIAQNKQPIDNNHVQNSDLPFKCHLCEGSFVERQDALDHIKEKHISEYELLMSKNALDNTATTPDDLNNPDEDENEIRGKFPDYSNRKVICAFCMRRFWSAEDLRRHMRTHTGERPFSCDICRRRFTLKHSMLRHRKKHDLKFESDNVQSDEDGNPSFEKLVKNENNNNSNKDKTDESDCNESGDLISNLLGIRDSSIIEKVLTASADDAAKLLGVKNGQE